MNKPLDESAPRMTEKQFLRMIGEPVPFAGRKAKENARRVRRSIRREAIARKWAWVEA